MRLSVILALLATALCSGAWAQIAPLDPDWKEAQVPSPPALRTEGLIPLELQRTDLSWGVDPQSVSVGQDGIVRYVVVATSRSGAVNAFFEGVRCTTAEVKVYARHAPGAGWAVVQEPEWRPLHGTPLRHSLAIARGGACHGSAPNGPAGRVVQDLQSTPGWRDLR